MTEQERAAARRWLEWADDTGKEVIRAAELRAQGFGEVDMRTLLHMAFQAGAHAQWVADGARAYGPSVAPFDQRGLEVARAILQCVDKGGPDGQVLAAVQVMVTEAMLWAAR